MAGNALWRPPARSPRAGIPRVGHPMPRAPRRRGQSAFGRWDSPAAQAHARVPLEEREATGDTAHPPPVRPTAPPRASGPWARAGAAVLHPCRLSSAAGRRPLARRCRRRFAPLRSALHTCCGAEPHHQEYDVSEDRLDRAHVHTAAADAEARVSSRGGQVHLALQHAVRGAARHATPAAEDYGALRRIHLHVRPHDAPRRHADGCARMHCCRQRLHPTADRDRHPVRGQHSFPWGWHLQTQGLLHLVGRACSSKCYHSMPHRRAQHRTHVRPRLLRRATVQELRLQLGAQRAA
mmetsp:Transcript_8404/g.20800  ORF Transcript_8404/g.20800 Transcript_8404/m.20800 type:complete len:294 (-) Transcript_8404:4790-5671(-)